MKTIFIKTKFTIIAFTALSVLCFASCSKKDVQEVVIENTVKESKSHKWFCFTQTGFTQIPLPQNAPYVQEKPWTEAVRISSSSAASNEDGMIQKGYMIVNRMGVITLDNDTVELYRDQILFSERTAGNLVFLNGTPIYSLYKSAFFNNPAKDKQHPFLVQFDPASKISYPLVNCDNLTKSPACEVTDFIWDGRTWFCCIKSEEDFKTDFSYIKWTSNIPLLNLSPSTAPQNISISESDVDTFRKQREPLPFSKAPDRIKKLLNGMASKVPFNLTAYTAGGTSPRLYSNVSKETENTLNAYGIISQTWSGIMFQEGTLYLEGALDGRRILRGGKPVAIRLPKLPQGFRYTSFVISGTSLYAAWEETDFYKTSRSGFIQVNLDETLYKEIKS